MLDCVYHNRLSELHNGTTIWFSKTERRFEDFKVIKDINNPVVLITANSDDIVTSAEGLPDNVYHWFCLHGFFNHPRVSILPGWIENASENKRGDYHGIYQERGIERIQLLTDILSTPEVQPTKFICANFSIETNVRHRELIAKICKDIPFIDWYERTPMEQFLYSIQDYQAIICPDGNGPETIRTWETLWLNRIPIIFNKELYNRIYFEYPVVYVDDPIKLYDKSYLHEQIKIAKSKPFDRNILTFSFWKNKILETAEHAKTYVYKKEEQHKDGRRDFDIQLPKVQNIQNTRTFMDEAKVRRLESILYRRRPYN
jgi:hypothetical protein